MQLPLFPELEPVQLSMFEWQADEGPEVEDEFGEEENDDDYSSDYEEDDDDNDDWLFEDVE